MTCSHPAKFIEDTGDVQKVECKNYPKGLMLPVFRCKKCGARFTLRDLKPKQGAK
jgi:hypothetical protein